MNEKVKAAVERLKQREGRGITARLAYEIDEFDALVALRLCSWSDIAKEAGVSPNTIYRARQAARDLRAEWIKKGLISEDNKPVETAKSEPVYEPVKGSETKPETKAETASEQPETESSSKADISSLLDDIDGSLLDTYPTFKK